MSASSHLYYQPTSLYHGLQNKLGENNCFLNVTIQLLWQLGPFRTHLLQFSSMLPESYLLDDNKHNMILSLCRIFALYQQSSDQVLPIEELRVFLSTLSNKFLVGQIADSNEALDCILQQLHAELSVICPEKFKCLSHFVFGGMTLEQIICRECGATSEPAVRNNFLLYFQAMEMIGEIKSLHTSAPSLFKSFATLLNPPNTRGSAVNQDSNSVYQMQKSVQFGKMLKKCMMSVGNRQCPDTSSGTNSTDPNGQPCAARPACQGIGNVFFFTLEPPLALALSLSWPSTSKQEKDNLTCLYDMIAMRLYLHDIFSDDIHANAQQSDTTNGARREGPSYMFRGLVCYYGLHYVSIFHILQNDSRTPGSPKRPDEMVYYLFDDYKVKSIGSTWEDVIRFCISNCYQPVLLLYELEKSTFVSEDMVRYDTKSILSDWLCGVCSAEGAGMASTSASATVQPTEDYFGSSAAFPDDREGGESVVTTVSSGSAQQDTDGSVVLTNSGKSLRLSDFAKQVSIHHVHKDSKYVPEVYKKTQSPPPQEKKNSSAGGKSAGLKSLVPLSKVVAASPPAHVPERERLSSTDSLSTDKRSLMSDEDQKAIKKAVSEMDQAIDEVRQRWSLPKLKPIEAYYVSEPKESNSGGLKTFQGANDKEVFPKGSISSDNSTYVKRINSSQKLGASSLPPELSKDSKYISYDIPEELLTPRSISPLTPRITSTGSIYGDSFSKSTNGVIKNILQSSPIIQHWKRRFEHYAVNVPVLAHPSTRMPTLGLVVAEDSKNIDRYPMVIMFVEDPISHKVLLPKHVASKIQLLDHIIRVNNVDIVDMSFEQFIFFIQSFQKVDELVTFYFQSSHNYLCYFCKHCEQESRVSVEKEEELKKATDGGKKVLMRAVRIYCQHCQQESLAMEPAKCPRRRVTTHRNNIRPAAHNNNKNNNNRNSLLHATSTFYQPPMTSRAHVHTLSLPQDWIAHYDQRWILEDPTRQVQFGDIVHFPEMVSGAGDFEGVYLAVAVTDGIVALWQSDVEQPTFPPIIADMLRDQHTTLQAYYELSIVEGMFFPQSIADTFGENSQDFWESAERFPTEQFLSVNTQEWHFPYIPYRND
eukprot:gene27135-32779_t